MVQVRYRFFFTLFLSLNGPNPLLFSFICFLFLIFLGMRKKNVKRNLENFANNSNAWPWPKEAVLVGRSFFSRTYFLQSLFIFWLQKLTSFPDFFSSFITSIIFYLPFSHKFKLILTEKEVKNY